MLSARVVMLLLISCLGSTLHAQNLTAQFQANPLEVCLGDPINFTDLSTAGTSPIQTWNWDFGDGNSSQNQNPTHTYTAAGTFNVTLTVQASDGTSDVEIKTGYITIHPLPSIGFSLVNQGCSVPFNAIFDNNSDSGNHTYLWDFGNGQTSTDFIPQNCTYTAAGTYDVSLTVTNTVTGCSDVLTQQVSVVDFQAGLSIPTDLCLFDAGTFNDNSSVTADEWLWNFGDGNTATQSDPSHFYSTEGTFTVTLIATDNQTGCTDTVTQDLVVHPLPDVQFTYDETLGCNPLTVNFTNTSTGTASYEWHFGDGTTFTGTTPPPHVYTVSDTFSVTLIATDANGCQGIAYEQDLIIVQDLVPSFTLTPVEGCEPIDVSFGDLSTPINPNDPIISWNWDFGNGNTYSGQNPPMQTYNVGVYDVELTIQTASGCIGDIIFVDTITVGAIDSVDFVSMPDSICAKNSVLFTNLTSISVPHDPQEVIYSWDFGDGGGSGVENPVYTYPVDTGYFDVQLIVNFRGCIDSIKYTDVVHVSAPISQFLPTQQLICNPPSLPVQLDILDQSIIGEFSDDAEMYWDFGDGGTQYMDDPEIDDQDLGSTQHTYTDYGTYEIQQIINNFTTGCSDTSTQMIYISYIETDMNYSADSLCLGDALLVTDNSVSSHAVLFDTLLNYYQMGNGIIEYGSAQNYIYQQYGTYGLVHYAQNYLGCLDYDTVDITVLAPPMAQIDPPTTGGCAPLLIDFQNNSQITGNGVALESFTWVLPDNSQTTTNNINQTVPFLFDNEGTFQTTLVVTDAFGCISDSAHAVINITKPTADFTIDSVVCNNEDVNISNQSLGDVPLQYQWFSDNVPIGTGSAPSHQYNDQSSGSTTSASHEITLVVEDVNGCFDTLSVPLVVSLPHADANFSFTSASVNQNGEFACPPVFASLVDSSQSYGAINNWSWTFGNGNSSTLENPQNTYVFAGTYTATLSVTDEFGCVDDTVFADYVIINGPTGDPGWTLVGDICNPEYEFFVDNQIGITNVEWNLGNDEIVFDTAHFNYAYDTSGTYIPIATISDDNGCAIPYELPPITVNLNILDAFFTASMTEGEVSELFTFDDASTWTSNPIVSWQWDFDESVVVNNTDANIDNFWNYPGYHDVILTVYDSDGCSDSYSLQVYITANFNIPNVFTPNNDNTNDLFTIDYDVFDGYTITILNRWGNIVHQVEDHDGVVLWDGTDQQNQPCNDGVYFYVLRGKLFDGTPIEKHGHVTLQR